MKYFIKFTSMVANLPKVVKIVFFPLYVSVLTVGLCVISAYLTVSYLWGCRNRT